MSRETPRAAAALLLVLASAAPRADLLMDGSVRVLRLRVAVDEELRRLPDWQTRVQDALDFASGYYERNFAIRFSVTDTVEWASDDSCGTLADLVDALERDVARRSADVVLGFTAQRLGGGKTSKYASRPWGLTPSLGHTSVLRVTSETEPYSLRVALVHEVAHLFGAFHVAQQDSIMRETVQGPRTFQMDLDNEAAIRLMRRYDFARGVEGLDDDTARRLTELWEHSGLRGESNPVAEAYYNLGVQLHNQGASDDALHAWQRASRYGAYFADPHGSMALALAERHQFREALQELSIADQLGWPPAKQVLELIRHEQQATNKGH